MNVEGVMNPDSCCSLDRPHNIGTGDEHPLNGSPSGSAMVFPFDAAPSPIRKLSRSGGDEDWVLLAWRLWMDRFEPPWAAEGTSFGCCSVERHYCSRDSIVLIGSHA
jgi:hypothetical protein